MDNYVSSSFKSFDLEMEGLRVCWCHSALNKMVTLEVVRVDTFVPLSH
jgi:hypothetical protein